MGLQGIKNYLTSKCKGTPQNEDHETIGSARVQGRTYKNMLSDMKTKLSISKRTMLKGAAVTAIVAVVILAIVAVLAQRGIIHGNLEQFMNHKFVPFFQLQAGPWLQNAAHTVRHWMQSDVPSWSVPATVGGLLGVALTGVGAYKGVKAIQARRQALLTNPPQVQNAESSAPKKTLRMVFAALMESVSSKCKKTAPIVQQPETQPEQEVVTENEEEEIKSENKEEAQHPESDVGDATTSKSEEEVKKLDQEEAKQSEVDVSGSESEEEEIKTENQEKVQEPTNEVENPTPDVKDNAQKTLATLNTPQAPKAFNWNTFNDLTAL